MMLFDEARLAGRRGDPLPFLNPDSIAGWCQGTRDGIMAVVPDRIWPALRPTDDIKMLVGLQVWQRIHDFHDRKAEGNGQ